MNQADAPVTNAQDNGGDDERSRTKKININASDLDDASNLKAIDASRVNYSTALKKCEKSKTILAIIRTCYIIMVILWLLLCAIIEGPLSLIAWPVWVPLLVFVTVAITIDICVSRHIHRKQQSVMQAVYHQNRIAQEIRLRQEAQKKEEKWARWEQEIEQREREREKAKQRALQAKQRALEARINEVKSWTERCSTSGGLVTLLSSFPCRRGEGVLFEESGIPLLETRKIREKGGLSSDQWVTLDTGKVIVTNTRLVFVGTKGNRTVLIHDIVNMSVYADAIDVSSIKRERPMRFLWRNPSLISTIINVIQKYPNLKPLSPSNHSVNHEHAVEASVAPSVSPSKSKEDNPNRCSRPIPAAYFEMVKDAAESIGTFISVLSKDENVNNMVKQVVGIDAIKTSDVFLIDNPKLGFLVLEDIMKCISGLGYRLETLGESEAIGIWFALSQIVRLPEITLDNWNNKIVRDRTIQSMISFWRTLQKNFSITYEGDEFLVNCILSNGDDSNGYGQRFATLMYRWTSIVAKADGVVSPQESEFLAKIVKMGGVKDASPILTGKVKADPVVSKPMLDLEKMIGLVPVKAEVEKLANLVRIQKAREEQGIKAVNVSYHCVFTGNPGTGKTTVARIVAGIYKDLGVLKKGHLVETDRAGLVAEYVGQTGPKTNKVIDSALDGVLFIDEAYSLVEGGEKDYGKEAIATLLKRMEDDRERLVVILAGYSENMKRFIESNPGLQSRFNRYIDFPDYGVEDLVAIFKRFAKTSQYRLGDGTEEVLRRLMEQAVAHKDEHFGNGRFARNVFEKAIERQAMRLASIGQLTKEMLQELLPEDIPEG